MNIQTLKEASDCLLNLAKPETQAIEHILLQDAFERILAEDITAKIPVPSFAKSAYDGYALRQADTAAASPEHPVTLDVTEVIPAGSVPTYPITEGKAARIMTGAPEYSYINGARYLRKHHSTWGRCCSRNFACSKR